MRDAAGEPTDGLHAARLGELLSQPVLLLGGALLLEHALVQLGVRAVERGNLVRDQVAGAEHVVQHVHVAREHAQAGHRERVELREEGLLAGRDGGHERAQRARVALVHRRQHHGRDAAALEAQGPQRIALDQRGAPVGAVREQRRERALLLLGRRARPARGEHSQGALLELDGETRLALERLHGRIDHALPERPLIGRRRDALAEAHDALEHLVLAIATVTNADQLLLRGEQEADRPLQLRLRGCGGFRGSLVVRARGGGVWAGHARLITYSEVV